MSNNTNEVIMACVTMKDTESLTQAINNLKPADIRALPDDLKMTLKKYYDELATMHYGLHRVYETIKGSIVSEERKFIFILDNILYQHLARRAKIEGVSRAEYLRFLLEKDYHDNNA